MIMYINMCAEERDEDAADEAEDGDEWLWAPGCVWDEAGCSGGWRLGSVQLRSV